MNKHWQEVIRMSHSPGLVVAITIGALLLLWGITQYLNLDILGFGRRKAMREFPEEAKRLGFDLKTSRSGEFGVYSGKYKGYFFSIDPDSNATIHLQMKPVPGLKEFMTKQGEMNFNSGNKEFDSLFRTRLVSPELGQKLSSAKPFITFAVQFGRRWKSKCNYIQIYDSSIYCSFKYGNGSYIPASILKQIVPEMVKLADLLQSAFKSK